MGRGKLALELIPKEKSRMLTFEKRKKGLMKKAGEFSTLCGVDTCMIIFGERGTEPEVWPPEKDEVSRIIDRYLSEGPDRRSKRTVGLPDFFINRKKKLEAELKKVRTANWEAKYPVSDEIVEGLSEEQLRSFLDALKGKLHIAKEQLAAMKAEKLQELANSEMVQYDFYANDNWVYSDQAMQGLSTFIDVKPGFEFQNGYFHDQHLLQPMPDPSTMYNSFSNEVMTFDVQGNIPYPMAHNDGAPSMLNGFGDHNYPPMPQNFQFPPIHGMSFHEPSFNKPSNRAFSGSVGQCEMIPMQPQMLSGMPFSMLPTEQQNVSTSQAASSMPFSCFSEMLIKGKGKGLA